MNSDERIEALERRIAELESRFDAMFKVPEPFVVRCADPGLSVSWKKYTSNINLNDWQTLNTATAVPIAPATDSTPTSPATTPPASTASAKPSSSHQGWR